MKRVLLIILVSMAMWSCSNEEETASYNSDVYIVSKAFENDTLFSVEAMIASNSPMQEVILEKDENTYQLELFDYSGFSFFLLAEDEDYTTEIPAAGTYELNIKHTDGTTAVEVDEVSELYLPPISIDTISYDMEDAVIEVNWYKNDAVDSYRILIEKNEENIFDSNIFKTNNSSIGIYVGYDGRINGYLPEAGDSLNVKLYGLMFDPDDSETKKFQAISISKTYLLVWPE